MSYVDNTLSPGERVVFRTRLSAIMFVWPIVIGVAAILLFIPDFSFVHWLAAFLLLIAAISGLLRYIGFMSSEFAVTNTRVIIKVGVFRRRTVELQRSKVEAIAVNQGIGGRLFGYGDIVVTGTGGTKEPFHQIGSPLEFSRAVQATAME